MTNINTSQILTDNGLDYLLVNSTNKYLVEYPELSENARYTLTGFSGSTGDALITKDNIYLFVDGRYHIQADKEVKQGVTVVKLQIGQKQDDEIRNIIAQDIADSKILGIVSKKVSQARLEGFKNYNVKLLDKDPINDFTEKHSIYTEKAFEPVKYEADSTFVSNLEEVSYLTGLRDFTKNNTSKIWSKLYINGQNRVLFKNDEECDMFLREFGDRIFVDKASINAHDFSLIKKPIHKTSEIKTMKSVKSEAEISAYQKAFERTDLAVSAIREYIETHDNLSEYDIAKTLEAKFIQFGAKSLSFNSIVAINKNSALAHYSKNDKNVILKDGDLVLIDCGAYYESGLATDITRVFVKGTPNDLQKIIYTLVLKTFLNCYNYRPRPAIGKDIDSLAHKLLNEYSEYGFNFNHGLGHGIGINVHEAPPNLSQNKIAETKIKDGMCFTIEPGLYNADHFGIRLENSCYMKDGRICSFVKMGYESKLIDFSLLDEQEQEWLKEFKLL